jgi:hypothetical protein
LSLHGWALIVHKEAVGVGFDHADKQTSDSARFPHQQYFFDDLTPDIASQDSVAVVMLLEAAFMRTKRWFPDVMSADVRTDNAGCYASAFLLYMLPVIGRKHGIRVRVFLHNESGDGKSTLDGHFGVLYGSLVVSTVWRTKHAICVSAGTTMHMHCSSRSYTCTNHRRYSLH